jgi:hypothetical protein
MADWIGSAAAVRLAMRGEKLITKRFAAAAIALFLGLLTALHGSAALGFAPPSSATRMVEWTVESAKRYRDPFNDVDVDVVFTKDGQSWRVPTFWRGGARWTVRFTPPSPGIYEYHLESTDISNPDLNGHPGKVTVSAYSGPSVLLKHGPIKISPNKRYFEHQDGTPFYWLGDTWWMGLSTRLTWMGFQTLTADRKAKGFTVVQTVAGLVPLEETCPLDPGCGNEGGQAWEARFSRINPGYFDYADRRIELLIDSGIVPAIVGAWDNVLPQIGVPKLERHWRYIIARYGAYPVLWILGGEVASPLNAPGPSGWAQVARYIRATDPYHHPLTAHEGLPEDSPLEDESLLDFRLFQPSHFGWGSIGVEVAQLDLHFARRDVTKPLVVGEIGYERLGETHLEDFQRVAFWLAMLNGAAGHTYGAAGTWESYSAEPSWPRKRWSFLTWEEGMKLPGSYQLGLGAKLLREYEWWRFEPHPEWITPRGTTLLQPRGGKHFHIDLVGEWSGWPELPANAPVSEWKKQNGNFHLPYAAGIPGRVRFIYLPNFSLFPPDPPTVLGIERGVTYRAYYWEPSLGVRVDLGTVARRDLGQQLLTGGFAPNAPGWSTYADPGCSHGGNSTATGQTLTVNDRVSTRNVVIGVDIETTSDAELIMRFSDRHNYLVAGYSATEKEIYLQNVQNGLRGQRIGRTHVENAERVVRLSAEVSGDLGIVSLKGREKAATSPIVTIGNVTGLNVGLACNCKTAGQKFENLEVRQGAETKLQPPIRRRLYDAAGRYRGELSDPGGPGIPGEGKALEWSRYGRSPQVLLDAYLPDVVPTSGDWLLVLDASERPSESSSNSQPHTATRGASVRTIDRQP